MNRATRDAFGDQLVKSGEDKNVVVLSADLSKATKIDSFAKYYPERFIEVGIAENNMIGIASGMSEHGYKVFLASFASFLTGKYDAIRCSLAYSNCPVVLVGTHGGLAIGKDGVTQMGLEDISLMRSLPNMMVLNPATYNETKSVVEYLCKEKLNGPVYLRLGRQPIQEIYADNFDFYIGGITFLKNSGKNVIFTTGCVLPDVIEAAKDIDINIISLTTLKPIYSNVKRIIEDYIHAASTVFTVEDHSIIGGLGSTIAEIMAECGHGAKLVRIGVQDVFPESGDPKDLYRKYGLSSSRIREVLLYNENK